MNQHSSSKLCCPILQGSTLTMCLKGARHIVFFLLATILLSKTVVGQQPTSANKSSRIQFIESSAQFWAGTAFDHLSSRGRNEANPFLRTSKGSLNTPRYYAFNGAVYVFTVFLSKKHPRAMNWTRRAAGWLHFGVSIHNLNQPKGALR